MPGEIDTKDSVVSAASQKLAHPESSDLSSDLSDIDAAAQSPNIPVPQDCLPDGDTKCCCGRSSCAWLRHSNELVEDLERDVKTAGQLGQLCDKMERSKVNEDDGLTFALKALLIRHETYVAEAEANRREMTSRITHLETDKRKLETENKHLVQENHDLFDHLEHFNGTVADSEIRIGTLEASLNATYKEIKRLEILASKTSELETQLMELEREQEDLRQIITQTEAEETAATKRWRVAERKVVDLQNQLEKIEREAYDEKLSHEEVLRRIERQKQVDKELQTGKATVSEKNGAGGNVVSHFVKDILQDNVNLQMGIVELRDMLMSSNDEVQKLRDQLMGRGPEEAEEEQLPPTKSTLDAELTAVDPVAPTQALHVHHHYHVPKSQEVRRPVPKKKRNVSISDRGMHSRNSSRTRHRPQQPSIAATILSQTSMTIPSPTRPNGAHRWSMQSYGAPSEFASSAPSSPQEYRSSVLFDRMSIDQSMDYSRPTSPELSDYATSPASRPSHKRKVSEQSSNGSRNISPRGQQIYGNDTIHEEEDDDVPKLVMEVPRSPVSQDDSGVGLETERADVFDPFAPANDFRPKLRRSNSHESILSIAGQDIHTLKSRPSQMSISKSGARFNTFGASSAVLSTVDAFGTGELSAAGALSRNNQDSRSLLRSTAGLPERPSTAKSTTSSEDTVAGSLPKKQGGWIWGRWGIKPGPSTAAPSSKNTSAASSLVDVHPPPNPQMKKLMARAISTPIHRLKEQDAENDPLKLMLGRSPGINVAGPVPGWRKPQKAPSQVRAVRVDFEALREVLEEEA